MKLAARSITSVSWNIGANLVKVLILLARSVILARLLPVDVFGVYALAGAIITFSAIVPAFGLDSAFLHRAPETENEAESAAVHLTLRLIFTALWAAIVILAALLLAQGALRLALIWLALVYGGLYLTDTPRMILTRRVEHRRLAVLDLLNAIFTTLVAVVLAVRGFDLVALLSTDIATLIVSIIVLYIWHPVWRPRLLWLRSTVAYYLRFGSRSMVDSALTEAVDNIDDIWTGANLGSVALGYYSRAFTFATYPRRFLAYPVNMVAGGTYAELKEERRRLSQAFFRTNALLLRSGFLFGGLLVLLAPQLVVLLIGEKWLPMVPAFRLLAVFTLLDPIRTTISQLFVAVGRPQQIILPRVIQLIVLVGGLYLLGRSWGIAGVALAVDLMLLVGLSLLLARAREHADFSAGRLFGAPLFALALAFVSSLGATTLMCEGNAQPAVCTAAWFVVFVRGIVFAVVYCGSLYLLERQAIHEMAGQVISILRSPATPPTEAELL